VYSLEGCQYSIWNVLLDSLWELLDLMHGKYVRCSKVEYKNYLFYRSFTEYNMIRLFCVSLLYPVIYNSVSCRSQYKLPDAILVPSVNKMLY